LRGLTQAADCNVDGSVEVAKPNFTSSTQLARLQES
jgi:hypothetical protein